MARAGRPPLLRLTTLPLLAWAIGGAFGGQASAAEIPQLQGAWITQSGECSDVFTRRNGRLAFRPKHGFVDTSFIVSGNRIQGARASCTFGSEKRTADGLRVVLNCASRIATGPLVLTVRIPDRDTIIKFDPDFPELETTFKRCG